MSDSTKRPLVHCEASYWRREVLTLPNLITLFRAGCACWMLAEPYTPLQVAILAFLGWASDGIDGWVAKTFGMTSRFGARLDQYVDWLFGAAMLYAIYVAEPPTWYGIGIIWLISLYLLLRMRYYNADTPEVAKLKTFLQFSGGVVILIGDAGGIGFITGIGYVIIILSLPLLVLCLRAYHLQSKQNETIRPGP